MKLPIIPHDKANHFIYGFVIQPLEIPLKGTATQLFIRTSTNA